MISNEDKLIIFEKAGNINTILSVLQKTLIQTDSTTLSDLNGLELCENNLKIITRKIRKATIPRKARTFRGNLTNP